MNFLERLEHNCRECGDKIALRLIDGDNVTDVTYRELDDTVARTMAYLRAKGVVRTFQCRGLPLFAAFDRLRPNG